MAGFKTHITVSSLLGAGYGAAACTLFDVPLSTGLLGAGLCGVSGMLPDLDSGPGVPLRESCALAAAVVPMMLIDRFILMGWNNEMIVLGGAAIYLLIRFGLSSLLKRFTVHRGMFHSLLTAAIFGEVAFLLASGSDVNLRIFKAGGVVLGFVSHLVLDEIYSIGWWRGKLEIKRSFGTAVKFFSTCWWATLLTVGLLAGLSYVTFHEPTWMQQYAQRFKREAPSVEDPPATTPSPAPSLQRTAEDWFNQVFRK